ncbi:methylthioribulose 1-phosphate dehydratase [Neptunomonas qingdaonensis]|uniref:Methylthioribulose-1-phosphate dehydratase n=1 Tax=Neptunomonas qingdaonensis TaxID=1045558 RepID=A0A1I2P4N3_9GAMM|nr:methylthioribulose 1-phosphate dehydratase [Neptunomonas qingdaonensis]SFG11058.1 methylthioribulose-1-phosphate dehydratase [Neptunomonas qingdaonensis]
MSDLLTHSIVEAGRWIDAQGWCPATGGNFSARIDNASAWVTASGRHKGELTPYDLLKVNLEGQPIDSVLKPSAETLLHTALYALDENIGAVLHTHSVASTVLSRLEASDSLLLSGYEMQKSLSGNQTHDSTISIHVFENTQDMQLLAQQLKEVWTDTPLQWGFLVRGHGLYAWGRDMSEARRHLEGLEFLFACERDMMLLNR